jgi:hypothetical protein
MKQIGMITVARWMTETLPAGMIAYMEHDGKLFRLREVKCYNGHLRPLFKTPGCRMGGFPYGGDLPLIGAAKYKQSYTPESPVYLTMGGSLVGVALADVIDSVEEVQDRCWALQEGDGFIARAETAEDAEPQAAGGGEMWFG